MLVPVFTNVNILSKTCRFSWYRPSSGGFYLNLRFGMMDRSRVLALMWFGWRNVKDIQFNIFNATATLTPWMRVSKFRHSFVCRWYVYLPSKVSSVCGVNGWHTIGRGNEIGCLEAPLSQNWHHLLIIFSA